MKGSLLLRAGVSAWVTAFVALPLLVLVVRGLEGGPAAFWEAVSGPAVRDAVGLSLWTAGLATAVNAVVGTCIAWVLVRWDVPGRRVIAALVDLPLAIPTLVAGMLILALLGPQAPLGRLLDQAGLQVAFARPGIVLALLFVTLPFVVRAVEPVLEELDPAEEEAATTLGARPVQTFLRVLLPPVLPAVAAGAVQTFARSVAEFGSLAAVSGNIPFKTLVAPVYVLGEVEAGNTAGAASVSLVLLALALTLQPLAHVLARRAGGGRG
ncbi:sulfate ABC transporter permease subunit [Myxococcota bacterium]|nr:sulfate ABC transporter permease subunit [Myxococcota bacterium]